MSGEKNLNNFSNEEVVRIVSPDDAALEHLCILLQQASEKSKSDQFWPETQLDLCAMAGVFGWFIPEEFGGANWATEDLVRGYLSLAEACLTTTFVITQRSAACRRIAMSENDLVKQQFLPGLATGQTFTTVGISHLTTSHRHIDPVLKATEVDGGYRVTGFSPWVTGGSKADFIVAGATLDDGREILFIVETSEHGVSAPDHQQLVALTGSYTGRVNLDDVFVAQSSVIGGPRESVLTGFGGGAGGFQTSALALGLSNAAIKLVEKQAGQRDWLSDGGDSLRQQHTELVEQLLSSARGNPVCTNEELRIGANSLVLRATQAALVAAKGAGYVTGHPAGRWCREALFFLVWSCPTAVSRAGLCELAGIE
ncbi:MAG: acyl-CoA dehydrogenase family protein [Planctomycetota bacterium]